MPWQEMSVMEQRRDFIMLAMLDGANISELCRRFGISRQTGHKWLRRFSGGLESDALCDRSRRPRTSPRATAAEVEASVLAVRDSHPAWGARKIAHCLARDGGAVLAPSTVHKILVRHGRIAAPGTSGTAYGRFERTAANQLWQMDFKGRTRIANGQWCHPLTVLDDHSRFAVCLKSCADERGETVKSLLEKTFVIYGLPQAMYVDNGAPWGTSTSAQWTQLSVWLLKLGIHVIHSRPYHPQGRGKNERFHKTLKAEVFDHTLFASLSRVQRRFDEWRTIYNTYRPHQTLGMKVPASRYQPSARPFPAKLPEPSYQTCDIVRRVGTTKGYISFKGRKWRVPQAFFGERVAIRPDLKDGQYKICFGATQIATIDLNAQKEDNQ